MKRMTVKEVIAILVQAGQVLELDPIHAKYLMSGRALVDIHTGICSGRVDAWCEIQVDEYSIIVLVAGDKERLEISFPMDSKLFLLNNNIALYGPAGHFVQIEFIK